jgi:hypothetical protein
MPSYAQACKGFSDSELRRIEARLAAWAGALPYTHRIVRNIQDLEYFLHPGRLHTILRALLADQDKNPQTTSRVYRAACLLHVLKGEGVQCSPPPPLVCRAADREEFYFWFWQQHREIYVNQDVANDALSRLLDLQFFSEKEESFTMSPYAAWVTWSPPGSPDEPIETMVSASLIRACLGLDPEGRNANEPLLLLIYAPPSELLKPTIADAELHYQFEPPPESEPHYGKTRPLRNDLNRRPEAVHPAAPFSLLRGARTVQP